MSGTVSVLRKRLDQLPITDSHDHLVHPDIGRLQPAGTTSSLLAERILALSNKITFRSSGMPDSVMQSILTGEAGREAVKQLLLPYLKPVETTIPYVWMMEGIRQLYGVSASRINESNWDAIEGLMEERYKDQYGWTEAVFDRFRIRTSFLNIWPGRAHDYFFTYADRLTERDKRIDERCFTRLATIDSHALDPFSALTKRYAESVNFSLGTLEEYVQFLEKLADELVLRKRVRGFKFTEAYFRRLDYEFVSAETARKAYKPERTREEQKHLSDYIAYRILELAEKHDVPVQFHTGMRWGELQILDLNPAYLETIIQAFPGVKFDLLHGGFPYMGETAIMAAQTANVYVNLAYLPLISHDAFAQWLGVYLDMIPSNKMSIGWDVFNLETLCGGLHFTKNVIANVLDGKVRGGIFSEEQAIETAQRLLCDNAMELYKL